MPRVVGIQHHDADGRRVAVPRFAFATCPEVWENNTAKSVCPNALLATLSEVVLVLVDFKKLSNVHGHQAPQHVMCPP